MKNVIKERMEGLERPLPLLRDSALKTEWPTLKRADEREIMRRGSQRRQRANVGQATFDRAAIFPKNPRVSAAFAGDGPGSGARKQSAWASLS